MRAFCLPCLLLALMFTTIACGTSRLPADRAHIENQPADAAETQPAKDPAPAKTEWNKQVLAAVAEYTTYKKIADYPLWAPAMCDAPMPSVQFMSDATPGKAHGEKLYYLWVKDAAAYSAENETAAETPQPAGQVIVKETFYAEQDDHGSIKANGKAWKAGDRGPLFVMMRFDEKAIGTDSGWIYATLTQDGKEVTSAGRLDSCMGCHDDAGADRVFGVKPDMVKDD